MMNHRIATLRVESEEVRGKMAAEARRRDRAKLEAADILGGRSIGSQKSSPKPSTLYVDHSFSMF